MKIIITENQSNQLGLETKADVLHKLMMLFFPENYESYAESVDQTEVFDSENENLLLFYYTFETKEFYIGGTFIDYLFKSTGLPFLNIDKVRVEEREMFNNLIKVFAKRHYGWNVDKVWLHWY